MKRFGLVKTAVGSGLILVLASTSVLADGPRGSHYDRGRRGHHESHGERYYRHGDGWAKAGWFGFGAAVAVLTVGALVDALPPRHTTVIVENEPYYYYDGTYFRPSPGGYVVVPAPVVRAPAVVVPPPAPVVVAAPVPVVTQESLSVTVNIPNIAGGYTPVILRRSGSGFVGPQGEYYPEFPKVEQLRLMYSR